MSSVEFPKEWCLTNLGIIVELKYGRSLTASKRDGGKFPVYGSNGVVGGHSELLVEKEGIIVVVGRKGSCREVQLRHLHPTCQALKIRFFSFQIVVNIFNIYIFISRVI